jgi:GTP-binding protein HflX
LPQIALAGYTNAGKSTLLNALTGAEVGVGNRLFHTLDPTTRGYGFEGRRYLVTDTVGFIEKLPHQLVEAFKATLEETVLADLLLHVVDSSASEGDIATQMQAADDVLEEIGAGSKPRLIVLNKIDLLDDESRAELRIRMPDAVPVSAVTGEGIEQLKERVERTFEAAMSPVELFVPYSQGARLHDLHEVAGRIDRQDEAEGVRVRTMLPAGELHRFADLAVGPA